MKDKSFVDDLNTEKIVKTCLKLELLNLLSSYSGFRSRLGWKVMKCYYLNFILPLMTQNDLKIAKKWLKIAKNCGKTLTLLFIDQIG
jgi:hypothetical protein